jgi:hypothetical protein
MAAPGLAQQPAQTPRPAQTVMPTPDTRPGQAVPVETPSAAPTRRPDRATLPQGFSVVLVLGDIQGATTADDVPPAARKALVDMREFLPFKSYKLLDAAWVMCCGQDARSGGTSASQMLRGPDDSEYELKLFTSRAEGAQVFVRFTLFGSGTPKELVADAASSSAVSRTTARRIADLKDQRALLATQIQDLRKRAEVGIAPASDVPKLEVELRRVDREIEDLTARLADASAGRSVARTSVEHAVRSSIIDTTFTMNVGETVVVGTSRLKGGSRALIALLTAVPPRTTTERRE